MLRSVGLDLGKGWIKVVEISSDLKLTNIGRIRIPRSDRENTRNEQELYAAKINELLSNLKLTRENVVSNIRGSYILARTYSPPSSNKDEFERWFVKSIESIIPGTPVEEVVYSYELLPSGRALIAFARRKEIEKQLEMLKSCNIIPVSVDASCLALYDAFSPHPWIQKKENAAILDIGTHSTGVLIIKNGEAFGSNAMNLGAKDLIKGKDRANKFALNLGNDLAKIFTFYEKKENLRIQNIVITGKYATIPGLRKNLATKFNYTVELGDPFSLHKIVLPKKYKKKENPVYAQALGLALKGITKKGIDLIPYEAKESYRASLYHKKIKKFAKVSTLFVGLASVVLILVLLLVSNKNKVLSHKVIELENKKASLIYVSSEQDLLTNRILMLKKLYRKKIPWSKVLYDLGTSVPKGVYFEEITTSSRLISTTGTEAEKKIRIVVVGNSQSQKKVLNFIKNLEQTFEDIIIENIKGERRCEFKISLGL